MIIADAARVWVGTIRGTRPAKSTEVPAQPSRLVAPAGLIATPQEREALALATQETGGRFKREERTPTRVGDG